MSQLLDQKLERTVITMTRHAIKSNVNETTQKWLAFFKSTQTPKLKSFAAHAEQVLEQKATRKPPVGEDALARAREIALPYRDELGKAFYLVVGLLACALEANHRPDDEDRSNNYHVGVTYETLGWMAARAKGRDKPYCSKTVQRWLHPMAEHAVTLRKFLGWRTWLTDTLKDYASGESRGVVVGCHVFRVYLTPLDDQREVKVAGEKMRRPWRNLEADVKAKKTACTREFQNVRVYKTTRDDATAQKFPFEDFSNTPREANLLQDYYLYPDISSVTGAAQLRNDVRKAARWLCGKLEPNPPAAWDKNERRYLQAVWTVVKAELIFDDRSARELLRIAVRMAEEIDQDGENTLKNKASYIWSLIEKRGFRELRRDKGVVSVFNKSLYVQITEK